MAFSLVPIGMALSLTFGAMQPTISAEPLAQAQESRYEIDAGTISQSLNAWAASGGAIQTPLGSARLQQLSADISNGELIVRGTASTGWFNVPVDAAATASAQGGNVQVHVVDAHVNGMDVPDAARGQLEQELQSQVSQSIARSGVAVRSVQLGDGTLAIIWVGP
jgi:hypothetical protein